MNAVGRIGEFIIEYQNIIDISLLMVLALIVVAILIRGLVRMVRRKYVLNEISRTIHQISDAVETIERQQEELKADVKELKTAEASRLQLDEPVDAMGTTDSNSIDSKNNVRDESCKNTLPDENLNEEKAAVGRNVALSEPQSAEVLPGWSTEQAMTENDTGTDSMNVDGDGLGGEDVELCQRKQSTDSGGEVSKTVKYFTRDCNVDKLGRVYTEEELRAQIK